MFETWIHLISVEKSAYRPIFLNALYIPSARLAEAVFLPRLPPACASPYGLAYTQALRLQTNPMPVLVNQSKSFSKRRVGIYFFFFFFF